MEITNDRLDSVWMATKPYKEGLADMPTGVDQQDFELIAYRSEKDFGQHRKHGKRFYAAPKSSATIQM